MSATPHQLPARLIFLLMPGEDPLWSDVECEELVLVLRNEDTFDEVATLGESFRPALGVAGEEVADDKASPEELLFLQL